MTTLGVSKLISDSGVIRYKVIAERWDIYDQTKPPRQEFPHGIFLQQFDEKFHVSLYLTADTAYCYNQTLWKLRGRVFARNAKEPPSVRKNCIGTWTSTFFIHTATPTW